MSKVYNVAEMVTITTNYVIRMQNSSNAGVQGVDLNNEPLAIQMDKNELIALMSDSKCTGVYGILALNDDASEPDTQSIILVPHDDKGNALKTAGQMTGVERWSKPPKPPKLNVVASNALGVSAGVSQALSTIGIV